VTRILDPATADARELAGALRRECYDLDGKTPKCGFATALLAVLDECELARDGSVGQCYEITFVRAAACAAVAAGLELKGE
jgi:hypothetical protein